MKLYKATTGDYVLFLDDARVPPGASSVTAGTVLKLHGIDGMYSHCTDDHGGRYHPAALSEVEVVIPV